MLNPFKYFSLSKLEKKVFLQAVRLLAVYRILLWKMPFEKLYREVEGTSKEVSPRRPGTPPARTIGQLIETAARVVPYSTCLTKSLVGKIVCARNGYSAMLHIGIGKNQAADFKAHAWLSVDDEIIVGEVEDLGDYAEFPIEGLDWKRSFK